MRNLARKVSQRKIRTSKEACAGQTGQKEEDIGEEKWGGEKLQKLGAALPWQF